VEIRVIILKNSKPCDHGTPTPQTDRTTCHSIAAICRGRVVKTVVIEQLTGERISTAMTQCRIVTDRHIDMDRQMNNFRQYISCYA